MFGGSSISQQLFEKIRDILPEGKTILEFGSGEGTNELLKHYQVISVEHNPKYAISRGKNHTVYLVPVINGWYARELVEKVLDRHKFDLILVDGPPGECRGNIRYKLFNSVQCPVIFDDVNRAIDREAMIGFCEQCNYQYEIFSGEEKSFAACQEDVNHTSQTN